LEQFITSNPARKFHDHYLDDDQSPLQTRRLTAEFYPAGTVANAPAPPGPVAVARKGRPGGSDSGNHRRRRVFPRERRLAEPVIASVAEKTDTEAVNAFCG
jgi:hypothetical protein